jgi:hypothetical protein
MSEFSAEIKAATKNSCTADNYKPYLSDVMELPSMDKVKFVPLTE